MTTLAEFDDLKRITRARYEQRQQSFAKVVAEENLLRGELRRLDNMGAQATRQVTDATHMRAIGADVIWQGWLGRAKTSLNLRLARVLAVKEHHLLEVRRAYGKVLVVDELQTQLRNDTRHARNEAALDQAIGFSLSEHRRP